MRTIVATAVSALLYALLFPPLAWGWLSWVALVPLVLALRNRGAGAAAGLAALWGWLATLAIIVWLVPTLHQHFERSLGSSVAFWLLFSTTALSPYYAVLLAGYAYAARRLRPELRPLLFAAAWAAAELARTELGFRSPWTLLGEAHAGSAHLRQIVDVTGVYGLSALVALANAAVAETIAALGQRAPETPRPMRAALAGVAALGLALPATWTYGALRLRSAPTPTPGLEVGLVQGNLPPEHRWRRSRAARVLRQYAGATRQLLREADGDAPDLVVWPENAIQTPADDPIYGLPLRMLVSRGTPLLIGAPRSELRNGVRHHFNSAILLHPDGRAEHYDKRRLLPFSETRPFGGLGSFGPRGDLDVGAYTPGHDPGLFRVGRETVAVFICMEALYPELTREAVRKGATVLANLSNDGWYRGRGGAAQHFQQVVLRAIETRTPLVRATTTGISAIVAPDGSVTARLDEGTSGFLRVALPSAWPTPTVYARAGDAFAFGCGIAWLVALVAARLAHARAARRPRSSRATA